MVALMRDLQPMLRFSLIFTQYTLYCLTLKSKSRTNWTLFPYSLLLIVSIRFFVHQYYGIVKVVLVHKIFPIYSRLLFTLFPFP